MDEQLKMIEDFFTAKGVDTATVQAIKDQSKVGFKVYFKKFKNLPSFRNSKFLFFLGKKFETKQSNTSMIMLIMTMAVIQIW